MNIYGAGSKKQLATVCPSLQILFETVLQDVDHSAVEGARSQARQNELFLSDKSKVMFPNSKHNVGDGTGRRLSDALDVVIWHPKYRSLWGGRDQIRQIAQDFKVTEARVYQWFYMQYADLNARLQVEAARRGIKIRWGGDWNSANGVLDQTFDDFYHWEIVR